MSYNNIPLLRAAVCEHLIATARHAGAPVERYARASRLSLALIEDTTTLVPQIPVWRFLEMVTIGEGDVLFGLRMNLRMPPGELKTINPFLENSANLLELLKRFCASIRLQTNVADHTIEEDGELVWVYTNQVKPCHADAQVELFELTSLICLVQSVLGSAWHPEIIDFQFVSPCREIVRSPVLGVSQCRYGRSRAGIAIRRADLSMPVEAMSPYGESSISTNDVCDIPVSLRSQVTIAIGAMLVDRRPTISRLEDIVEMNLRTLQRRLRAEGTSFQSLVERVRLQRAQQLLTETDIAVSEISMMLGYANPPAFSRSFRRWSAVTPQEYRKIHCNSG